MLIGEAGYSASFNNLAATQMLPEQTSQVFVGASVAALYCVAVTTFGFFFLTLILSQKATSTVCAQIGRLGFFWSGFVIGQGILGLVWLILSLCGVLHGWLVWAVIVTGWSFFIGAIAKRRPQIVSNFNRRTLEVKSSFHTLGWYTYLAVGIALIIALKGIISLVPSHVDDAVHWYLTVARVIADTHTLQFLPFVTPHNALYPLQVELHWAALFAVSNETAVTAWDYLCAVSFIFGVGYLGWSLTSSRRIVLVAVLLLLSTPGFYHLMGGAKADNAAAQYGVAAFLWVTLLPILELRALMLAVLCIGWAVAARYTNIILLPGLALFVVTFINSQTRMPPIWNHLKRGKKNWLPAVSVCGIAAAIAILPMLIKNWVLVGCPLAPFLGCEGQFWSDQWVKKDRQNLSPLDLLLYPFVWTFADREDMLGNISPLFIGLVPLLVAYRTSPVTRIARMAGSAGLASLFTWWVIHPFILFTRWLLVPLALFAVSLASSVVAAESDLRRMALSRWLFGATIATLLFFLLFESREVIYSARYIASIDTRSNRYASMPGFDVANWINSNVVPGKRVALAHWSGYPYFLESHHLMGSESQAEFQQFWENNRTHLDSSWTAEVWRFYKEGGFRYLVMEIHLANQVLLAWPKVTSDSRPAIVFQGRENTVFALEESKSDSRRDTKKTLGYRKVET